MKREFVTAGVLFSTVVWLAAWTRAEPFDVVNTALDKAFGALPPGSQVENLYRDPDIQETSGGQSPLASFARLTKVWSGSARRVVFIGNSQMQAMSLAPDEMPQAAPEKTWVDQIADSYRASPEALRIAVYRLSAVGMTYAEALWYTLYLAGRPELKPDVLFLQINYQSMWNSGIRDGMLELLEDPGFRRCIEEEADRKTAYSALFAESLRTWRRKQAAQTAGARRSTGIAEESGPGARMETRVRDWLTAWRAYRRRAVQRDSFLDLLYRGRIYFLQLRPSTARSISESRLIESHAAIDRMAELCRESGIRMALVRVPVNPKVSLYRVPRDKTSYEQYLEAFRSRFHFSIYDLEDSVPAGHWGMWFNGPDPLHMSRAGHRIVAAAMFAAVARELAN